MLSCSNIGIVVASHNEICDAIIRLARQSFSPNCVRGKPLILQGHIISEGRVHHSGIIPETQGDVSIQLLWGIQTEATIGVRFIDDDAET